MEGLSITASVVGITMAALQSVQLLAHAIDGVKGAPNTIKDVRTDLGALEPVLQSLARTVQDGSLHVVLSKQIENAVQNCNRACGVLQLQIEQWMERSKEDKMFWVDRWKVGLIGLERIKTFRGQLSDCKGTLTVVLSTATIIKSSHQEFLMQEMKDMMLKRNEAELQQQITRAGNERREIELSIQRLPADSANALVATSPQDREAEQSGRELLHELEEQKAASQMFVKVCEEALSQTFFQRTGLKIKGVRATNNSSALTGFINASGEELKIDQDVSDITADDYSIIVAGIVNNLDFKDLRNGPRRG